MKKNIDNLTYQDAMQLNKKTCVATIENKIVGDGFEIASDEGITEALTIGTEYFVASKTVDDTYFIIALISGDNVIVIKSGKNELLTN